MSLKLYFGPGACSFVPHVLLEASGAPFEPLMVKLHKNEQQSPEYRAVNPRAQVPVLVDGAETVTQLIAIVSYLNDKFPEAGFLPVQPLARARVFEKLAWMNNTFHPTFTHIFMPWKFTDKPELHADLKRHNTALYRAMMGELQVMVGAAGDGFLGGDRLGPLDAYALTLTRWGTLAGINPEDFPVLWAFVQHVAAQAPVARAIERERLQLNLYQPA
jgi:glutathione S-transferase